MYTVEEFDKQKTKVLKYGGTVTWGYKGNKYVANITFFNIFSI